MRLGCCSPARPPSHRRPIDRLAYGAKEGQRESIWRRGESSAGCPLLPFLPITRLSFPVAMETIRVTCPSIRERGSDAEREGERVRRSSSRLARASGRARGVVSSEPRKMAHSVVERPHRRQTVSCSLLHSDALEGLAGFSSRALSRAPRIRRLGTDERVTPSRPALPRRATVPLASSTRESRPSPQFAFGG